MKIGFKDASVRISPTGLRLFGVVGAQLCATAPKMIDDTVIITSCNDGIHSRNSFHYVDRGFDVRYLGRRIGGIDQTHQKAQAREWAARLKQALGPAFDVVVEIDHIHIEYERGNPIE